MSSATSGLAETAAPLDMLLVDAALGPVRRFVPDMSTAKWAVSLARKPGTTARRLGDLGAEVGRVLSGTSTVAPRRGDRRFTDTAWSENPLLRRLVQLYLAGSRTAEQLVAEADLEPRDRKRVQFFLENLAEALAPSNVPLVNPGSAKAVIDTAGLSLVRGGKQLVRDMASAPRIPEMVDGSGFVLGDNIAATPGGVVFRNEVLELIQYAPQTDEVYEVPALVVPPDDQQVLCPRPRPGAQPRRTRRAPGTADVRHLLAKPGLTTRLLEPRHLCACRPGRPGRR